MADRKSLIKTIHTAKKALAMDDVTYREFLYSLTKRISCTELNIEQLQTVLAALRTLGFEPKRNQQSKNIRSFFDFPLYSKAYALWQELHTCGKVKNKSIYAFHTYLKKHCELFRKKEIIIDEEFITAIETLKKWLARKPKKA